VLKIAAKNGVPDKKLDQDLIDLGKKQSLDFVYYVQTLGGELSPRLLYRVSIDGKRELVRGAELDDLDQRALRSSLVAAGKDLYVANSFGDVPQTVLAPALLFNDATVRRANEKNEKLPFYSPPD
jgi:TldD protein